MTQANRALAVLLVAAMGLWGCTKGPGNGVSMNERINALENKCSKLEDDYQAAASARDQLRKKLAATEEERNRLQQEFEQLQQASAKEREDLRQQLTLRTAERDTANAQFESFRKGIRALLGQADLAASGQSGQPVSNKEVATPGKG